MLDRLAARIDDGVLVIAASEHRSQWQNRTAAGRGWTALLRDALEPPSPARRATRPSRAAQQRRLDAKRRRGEVKANRRRPDLVSDGRQFQAAHGGHPLGLGVDLLPDRGRQRRERLEDDA